ncbi:MAG: GNAT family N-acetyltransferase [Clostridiales bacterium]|jgi:RimJ/RimL family protein N-acetyltransferase/NTP pyrophosphatase (non-canonical NTP hydrolase)|nr:GNAT family N-acetyltransferase [Clostridiales bacterium]
MQLNTQTERLILRKIHTDDFNAFAEYYGHPAVAESLFGHPDIDKATIADAFDFNMGLEICFSIVLKSTGKVIGNIHFVNITEHYLAEVGYILHPDHWGLGLMTEALAAAVNFALDDYGLGLAKIRAATAMDNMPSVRLLERLGFTHEATLRDAAYGGRVADVGYFSAKRDSAAQSQQELLDGLGPSASLAEIQAYVSKVLRLRGIVGQTMQHALLLLCEEVGELAKAIRKNTAGMSFEPGKQDGHSAAEELADIIIIICEIANTMGINLAEAFIAKERENVGRVWDFIDGDNS